MERAALTHFTETSQPEASPTRDERAPLERHGERVHMSGHVCRMLRALVGTLRVTGSIAQPEALYRALLAYHQKLRNTWI